jgi:hypothetical protein
LFNACKGVEVKIEILNKKYLEVMISIEELLHNNFYEQDSLLEFGMKPKRQNIKNTEWEKIKENVTKHEKIFDVLKSFSFDKKLLTNNKDQRIDNSINSSFK